MSNNLVSRIEKLRPDEQKIYLTLKRDLSWREGFGILFIKCSPIQESLIVGKIKQDIPDKKIDVLKLEHSIDNLYDLIEDRVTDNPIDILFISGIEKSFALEDYIKHTLEKPKISHEKGSVSHLLGHLNWQRERFRDDFNCCLVFTVRKYTLKYLVRRAPDFFDWRSGVFEFPVDNEIDLLQYYASFERNLEQEKQQEVFQDSALLYQRKNIDNQEYISLLEELLLLEYENPGDSQFIYSVVKSNIDKFDDFFAQLLQQWIIDTCSKANPEEKEAILEIVEGLCIDIFQFPAEKLSNILEIVITGLETILTFRIRETFPKQRTKIHYHLGHAYRQRIRGNKAENIERAIAAFKAYMKATYNLFNPFEPLPANDPAYVNCTEVRGDDNIFKEIGKAIIYSDKPTCHLYTGHRGAGKSTELLRLEDYLQKNGCFVIYFPATEGYIDELDVQYTDIILACTCNILEQLQTFASPNLLLNWLQSRWHELKDLALSDIEFEKLEIESKINVFSKLTTSLRRIPSTRETIRKQVDNHIVSLIAAFNEFIEYAQKKLPETQSKIVVIIDNLDRIIPIERGDKRTSNDDFFLDYSNHLTALNCHVVYTIPISLAYSNQAFELRFIYDSFQILPMIMLKDRQNKFYNKGLDKLKEIIQKRVDLVGIKIDIDTEIFDDSVTRIKLCQMTGGHLRELMFFMQSAMRQVDDFPINIKAVNRAISDARDGIYRNAVNSEEWDKLAKVYRLKNIPNDEEYRSLLFRRCVLEYRDFDAEGNPVSWYDIHPLIEGISEFKSALKRLEDNEING